MDDASGDPAAASEFAAFVHARGPALRRTAFLLTGDWAVAEDLVQSALATSYLRWRRIRHDDPEGYVRRVLVTTHASWWRRRWRGETPTAELPDRPASDGWREVDDRLALASALSRLPPRQRAVIVLRFHEDLTEAAAAAVLGCSIGTVKSQTSKALARLRADPALSEAHVEDGPARGPSADGHRCRRTGRRRASGSTSTARTPAPRCSSSVIREHDSCATAPSRCPARSARWALTGSSCRPGRSPRPTASSPSPATPPPARSW